MLNQLRKVEKLLIVLVINQAKMGISGSSFSSVWNFKQFFSHLLQMSFVLLARAIWRHHLVPKQFSLLSAIFQIEKIID